MCLKIGPTVPFEGNYFPLLIGSIVLLNKKRNLRKYSVVIFKAFSKKKVFDRPKHILIALIVK